MALLLETTLGDVVIDLDVEGSPELCRNILKLAKARYFTSSLIYNVQPQRFCQAGDPTGNGSGGGCIYGLLDTTTTTTTDDITKSTARFLKSKGRALSPKECQEKGRVVATEMNGIPDTIGSQFLITLEGGPQRALDGYIPPYAHNMEDYAPRYLSLGVVSEDDNNVLDKIHDAYCDANGRPYADIRIERALVVYDPFDDPPGLQELMKQRGVEFNSENDVISSPTYERPPEENVEIRISANQVDDEEDDELDSERARQREEEIHKKEDKSRAVVLEMLGDLPSADIKAPENVLFVCKLNPITEDEDLELIFSRFDQNVKVEIIRDAETGASLQYAFCEFTTKEKCVEAYFKMNGALVDDRRIKVDFSQSVAKIWDRYNQKLKPQRLQAGDLQRTTPSSGGFQLSGGNRRGGRSGGSGRGGFTRSGPRSNERGGRGQHQQYRNEGFDRRGPPPSRDGRGRHDGPPSSGRRDDHRGRDWDGRDRYRDRDDDYHRRHHDSRGGKQNGDAYREERRHSRDEYSPRRDRDDFGRQRRSRSPSPERSRKHKRRKHSRKHHRHERSDDDRYEVRSRHGENDDRYNSPRRHENQDNEARASGSHGDGEESSGRRRDGDSSGRKRHRDRHDEDHKRRKKHRRHHRDSDDRDEHRRQKKRKHKEKRRRSRSRSAS